MLHLHFLLISQNELEADIFHINVSFLKLHLHFFSFPLLPLCHKLLLKVSSTFVKLFIDRLQLGFFIIKELFKFLFHLLDFVSVLLGLDLVFHNLLVFRYNCIFELCELYFHTGHVLEAVVLFSSKRISFERFQLNLEFLFVSFGFLLVNLDFSLEL